MVNVPDAGVPKTGATKVIPLAIVPATMLAAGKPEQFVNVPDAGVPRAGVVIVGLVSVLFVSVWDADNVTTVSELPGNVIVVLSVPARARVLPTLNVLPDVTLSPVTVALLPEHAEAVVAVAEFPEHALAVVAVAELPVQLADDPVVL